MWVRLQLDFSWRDHAYGLISLCRSHDTAGLKTQIESRWSSHALATLSVRSGLALLLETLQWPAGSEVVYSALNIPDMTMIARQHGLVPVPVDLDIERLAPDLDLLERAITPNTRAILVAHLYGNFVALEPIAELARKHNLMLIEDCAENYDGIYAGHPGADVSLFSFGPLKTATALAGGVMRVRDETLAARLRQTHERWPIQGRLDMFNRLCKYGTMKFFGSRWIFGAARWLARKFVGDVDKLIHHTAKSFRDDEIMRRLRQRPSGPLLASLARRLARFDYPRIARRTANGKLLTELLRGHVVCPGADVLPHNYWLYPVLVTDPPRAIAALADAGFDATHAQSMRAIDPPPDRPKLNPLRVRDMFAHMILVPCWPGIPEAELRRMADVLIHVEHESSQASALKVTTQPADTSYDDLARDRSPHAPREETASRGA